MNGKINQVGEIIAPDHFFKGSSLSGRDLVCISRDVAYLHGSFKDKEALKGISYDRKVYEVNIYSPVEDGTSGGLFFGITKIFPGKVGNEYFMTKGHYHRNQGSAEFYWCLEGEGMLIFMNRQHTCWAQKMIPGSLHYISGNIAHRVANTGKNILSFAACWPSDAGHDYKTIEKKGFSARLLEIDGVPKLID